MKLNLDLVENAGTPKTKSNKDDQSRRTKDSAKKAATTGSKL